MKGFESFNPRRISYDFDVVAGGKLNDVRRGNGKGKIHARQALKTDPDMYIVEPRYQRPDPENHKAKVEKSPTDIAHTPIESAVEAHAPIPASPIVEDVKGVEAPLVPEEIVPVEALSKNNPERLPRLNEGMEDEYEINRPSIQNWSYIKGLKNRDFNNNSPFPEQLKETVAELLGVEGRDIGFTDKKQNVLQIAFKNKKGVYIEVEMTQTEAVELLTQSRQLFDESDFIPIHQKKSPVNTPIKKVVQHQGVSLMSPETQKKEPLVHVKTADVDVSQRVNPYNLPKSTKERIGSEMHTIQDSSPDTGIAVEEVVGAIIEKNAERGASEVVQAEVPQNNPESPQTLEEAMSLIANESKVDDVESVPEHGAEEVLAVESAPLETGDENKIGNIPSPMKEGSLQNETPERLRDTEVASIFQVEFGITNKELKSIEGFENLSLPQQKMVFENLVQSTYGRVQEETVAQYTKEKETKHKNAVDAYGKIAGNAWAGIRAVFTKDFNLLKTEQRIADSIKKGGIEEHRTILEQLTQSMATLGPRVHEDPKTGELLVDLVNIEFDRENRKSEYEAVRKLNFAAHQFAKIPAAWRESTLGVDAAKANEWKMTQMFKAQFSDVRKQQLAYDESNKVFSEARSVLEETLRKSGKNEYEIAGVLLGIDTRVQQLQFMQASPDAITELAEIKAKNIYYETAKSMVGKSGLGYVALGYVGRTAAAGVLGWFAAPIVSSGIAASRSWTKTAAELRERDRNARMGTMDVSDTALNIVSAEGLVAKTTTLLDRYHTLSEQIIERESNGEDTTALKAARHTTLDRLNERVAYIHDKQKLNRVNYGARNSFVGTQVNLYKILGEATAVVENCALPDNESLIMKIKYLSDLGKESTAEKEQLARRKEVAKRLNKFIAYKETSIEERRRVYRYQQLATQSLKAGGFALAGSFLAEYYRDALASKVRLPIGSADAAIIGSTPEAPSPIPTESPVVSRAPSYTIERGDTLTKIFKEHIPEIKELETSHNKDAAIVKLLKTFSGDELERIGVKHGNANLIYAGDTINLDELSKIVASKRSVIESFATATDTVPGEPVYDPEKIAELKNKIDTLRTEIASMSEEELSAESKINTVRDSGTYEAYEGAQKIEDVTDLVLREKAEITQEYLKKNIFGDHKWNLYKDDLAIKYARMQQSKNPVEQTLARLFAGVGELPVKLIPQNNETIDSFLERVSIVIAQEKDSGKIPVKLLSFFQKIDQSDRFT